MLDNECYLSSEEDDLGEDGSDTSYLAQEIALPPGSYDPAIEIDQQTDSNHDTALTLAAAGMDMYMYIRVALYPAQFTPTCIHIQSVVHT